jgi:hypothetical protein
MIRGACFVLVLGLACWSSAAWAQVKSRTFEVELFGGGYDAAPDVVSSNAVYGVRLGYNLNRRFNVQGSLGRFTSDKQLVFEPQGGKLEYEMSLLDVTFGYQFFPSKWFVPTVEAGLGRAFVSTGGDFSEGILQAIIPDLLDDSLTLTAGGSFKLFLSERFYFRPAVQARWFEARQSDEVDAALTLAIGFRFGD